MRKLAFIIPVVALILLAGCEKFKLNKLKGYWLLKSWTLTDVNDSSFSGLTLFPEKTGEEIILEFPEDGKALLVVFAGDTVRYADNGIWTQEGSFETITFSDTVFFLNKNVDYEFVELSKSKLVLEGYFIYGTDSFPVSRLKFESID